MRRSGVLGACPCPHRTYRRPGASIRARTRLPSMARAAGNRVARWAGARLETAFGQGVSLPRRVVRGASADARSSRVTAAGPTAGARPIWPVWDPSAGHRRECWGPEAAPRARVRSDPYARTALRARGGTSGAGSLPGRARPPGGVCGAPAPGRRAGSWLSSFLRSRGVGSWSPGRPLVVVVAGLVRCVPLVADPAPGRWPCSRPSSSPAADPAPVCRPPRLSSSPSVLRPRTASPYPAVRPMAEAVTAVGRGRISELPPPGH